MNGHNFSYLFLMKAYNELVKMVSYYFVNFGPVFDKNHGQPSVFV